MLGDVTKGITSDSAKKKTDIPTLKKFLTGEYGEWRQINRKHGSVDIERATINFLESFGNTRISELSQRDLEKWCSKRLQNGIKASTINRGLNVLKAALSKAVEWGIIQLHPLANLNPLKVDQAAKIRFLDKDEEFRLRKALIERDQQLQQQRDHANQWRHERGYNEYPPELHDHLLPMLLLSINTGIRRGELFSITWENVDLKRAIITITGSTAKAGKTRHIPLNKEALTALKNWQKYTNNNQELVFVSKNGKAFTSIKNSWSKLLKEAQIENFRWRDLRHHFASKLVMAGVDINTVRELLGHSDIKMALRYAHLAPEHKAQAVAKLLVEK